jgi:hypothetical protein
VLMNPGPEAHPVETPMSESECLGLKWPKNGDVEALLKNQLVKMPGS